MDFNQDFVAMETSVVLNYVLKTNIAIITFLFGIKHKFYTILFVAMVTKFNFFNPPSRISGCLAGRPGLGVVTP